MKLTKVKVFDYLFSGVNRTFTPEEDSLIYPYMLKAQQEYDLDKPMAQWNQAEKHRFAKYVHSLIPKDSFGKNPKVSTKKVVILKSQIRAYVFEGERYSEEINSIIHKAVTSVHSFVPRSGRIPMTQWSNQDIWEYISLIFNNIKNADQPSN